MEVARWGVVDEHRTLWDLMSDHGRRRYIPEHRFVMAVHLGRPLTEHEVVHHRNGRRDDNAFSNLRLYVRGTPEDRHHPGYGEFYQQWQETLSVLVALLSVTHE